MYVLHSTLENGAFCLLSRPVWYDSSEFVDAFIYVTSPSTFNFFMIIFSLPCPLIIRHPSRTPPSGPPARDGIVLRGGTHAVAVYTSAVPTLTG